MKIQVVATARQLSAVPTENKTVVVIDVLRATSVITTALMNGASAVWPVSSAEEAGRLAEKFAPGWAFRCGEREGRKIPGFDLGNSPLEFTKNIVAGKNIILTTTNGTVAIQQSHAASRLYIVSFLNLSFAAMKLAEFQDELLIACSGTNDLFSMDDALCAGMLIDTISQFQPLQVDDLGLTLQSFARQPGSLFQKLRNCYHLNYLLSIGYREDVDYCLQTDLFKVLPVLQNKTYLSL